MSFIETDRADGFSDVTFLYKVPFLPSPPGSSD